MALGYSPDEAAVEVGLSRGTIYAALQSNDLRSAKIGRNRVILREDLVEWVKSHYAKYEKAAS